MTLWHPTLSTTLSISKLWPQMHYVYQAPDNGDFVACDNKVMLIEHGVMPFMFEYWNADGTPANVCGLQYVDYRRKMHEIKTNARKICKRYPVVNDMIGKIDNCCFPIENFEKVVNFMDGDYTVYYGDDLYICNSTHQKEAVISCFKHGSNRFKLLNDCEEVVSTFDSYEQAKNVGNVLGFNYIIKEV